MISKRIDIWEGLKYHGEMDDGFRPVMDTYILAGNKVRGAVLVCPGGGYGHTSPREAEAVAIQFNAAGFHAFVLYYSVAPRRHPQPILDLSRAMCIIRENAEEWKVDPNKIAVCGFSAGGHLAASLGVHWTKPYIQNAEGIKEQMNRPNALILCYPVITFGEFTHKGSVMNLLGDDAINSELLNEMSLENQVNENTPPSFLWHTFEDKAVPVENSLMFAQALRKNKIPFEMHIYPSGSHGLSLANEETSTSSSQIIPQVATWMGLCVTWLKKVFA